MAYTDWDNEKENCTFCYKLCNKEELVDMGDGDFECIKCAGKDLFNQLKEAENNEDAKFSILQQKVN